MYGVNVHSARSSSLAIRQASRYPASLPGLAMGGSGADS